MLLHACCACVSVVIEYANNRYTAVRRACQQLLLSQSVIVCSLSNYGEGKARQDRLCVALAGKRPGHPPAHSDMGVCVSLISSCTKHGHLTLLSLNPLLPDALAEPGGLCTSKGYS